MGQTAVPASKLLDGELVGAFLLDAGLPELEQRKSVAANAKLDTPAPGTACFTNG